MQKRMTMILTVLLGLYLLAGCGGTTPAPAPMPTPDPNDAASTWPGYMNEKPVEPGVSFATGTATSQDPQFAIRKAETQAKAALAGEIKTLVEDRTRTITQESGMGDNSQMMSKTVAVTEATVSEVMKGFKTRKKDYQREGNGYRAFVLMEVPQKLADEALMGAVAKDEELRARFMASKTFQDLEERFK